MKGQAFSLDFFVALSIFLLTIVFIVYISGLNMGFKETINEKAGKISDFLAVKKLGEENILDCGRILDVSSKGYDELRKISAPYDIYIEFKNTSAVCSGQDVNLGLQLNNNIQTSSVSRLVYLDNQLLQMVIRLYG